MIHIAGVGNVSNGVGNSFELSGHCYVFNAIVLMLTLRTPDC